MRSVTEFPRKIENPSVLTWTSLLEEGLSALAKKHHRFVHMEIRRFQLPRSYSFAILS